MHSLLISCLHSLVLLTPKALVGSRPVDILINSAGITHTAAFLDTSNEIFEVLLAINVAFRNFYCVCALSHSLLSGQISWESYE